MQPLIDIASYIKVNFRLSDAKSRHEIQQALRGSHAALLAEKVEDQEEFAIARSEGYEFFQGYFFCRPKIMANREIPPNRMNYLRLLIELTRTPLNLREVMRIVQSEASLCYRLLLLANSPMWGVHGDVTSVRHAFMLVGENRFRTLVSVAASCVLSQDQPSALISLSLERARFCELLAPLVGEDPTEQFMLGLLSLVDAMLETTDGGGCQVAAPAPGGQGGTAGCDQSGCRSAMPDSQLRVRRVGQLFLRVHRHGRQRRDLGRPLCGCRQVGDRDPRHQPLAEPSRGAEGRIARPG